MAFDAETRAALIDQVRRFVTETCVPVEAQVGDEDAVPQPVVDAMKALGLFGIAVPEEYGGLDLDMETECLVAMELGQTSPAFRSVAGTNIGIGSQALVLFGTEAQKQKWLPGVASGDLIASFALTEPEAGSDAAGLKTRAVRDGDHYILNGTKRYITNANKADLFTVMARTNQDEPGAKGVSAFIVERDTPGLSVGKPEKKMGQQGAHICDVIFENARVPAANMIAGEGEGFKVAMSVLDKGRLHISAVATGVSKRLIREMVNYALERKQFGKPIFEHQMLQALIADSQAETYAAECMIMDAARRRDAGEDITMLASCTKLFATEACGRVADRAVQIFGGAGYVTDYGIERFYRDVRIFRLYEGTSQIQQIIIARELARAAKAGKL